ncbi:MFS gliotoxin efflux transporter glia [Ophiobolus disseminans]|uniref:MFS gliotoxin efflux transporter glia n=1 Tax=Ophiobolus disseminans TaxID=1469910 RepID=A0A6A7A891_9PLEO|nr:MFS gliotoxin efflux transporter glia [Ophiobolus disseminans]
MEKDHYMRPSSDNETPTATTLQEDQTKTVATPSLTEADKPEYATGLKLFLIMFTILMSTSLAAIEIGIIATAIPGITDDFHRLDDVGWYGSVTLLLGGCLGSTWGKVYKYLSVKYSYLASVAFYLLGSIVAGAAPNSVSVIVGRAIQGIGGAGTLSGSLLVINYVAMPQKRPLLIGIWMGVFMIATIIGPLIGGAFTSGVSWRWCFYINLPLGAPIIVLVLLFLRIPKHIKPVPATWKEIIGHLDLPGFIVLFASLICLSLALQWGGQTKSWADGSVIATLVFWVVLNVGFFGVEWFQGDRAMMPLRLVKPRLVWANALYCFILNAALFLVLFYLPIYFQSVHGQSAIFSGVNSLPLLALFALGSVASGALIGKTRHLQPFQLASALFMTAGAALLYKLDVNSTKAQYIGPQILFGFGLGLGCQVPMTAVQGFAAPTNVANLTGIMLMAQAISGGYFLAAAQSLFANRLLQTLEASASGINAAMAMGTGASEIQHVFAGSDLIAVINAYVVGIQDVFAFALALSAFAVVLALVVPFKKLPDHGKKQEEINQDTEV